MKLKVGMYARTKSFKGFPSKIGMITNIEPYQGEHNNELYISLDNDEEVCRRWTKEWLIGEPSEKLIDLIQVGDYVNGLPVIFNSCGQGGNIVIVSGGECFNEDEIKDIVTKEQFGNERYEVKYND